MSNSPGVILNAHNLPHPRRFGLSVAACDSDGVLFAFVITHMQSFWREMSCMRARPWPLGEVGVADVALVHPGRVA